MTAERKQPLGGSSGWPGGRCALTTSFVNIQALGLRLLAPRSSVNTGLGRSRQTMCSWNPVLLCLGLCLSYMTGVTEGKLPKPSLWATPSPTIPVGSPVSIWCRGPPGARLYYLEKAGRPESLLKTHQPWPRNEVSFFISGASQLNAGPYLCSYQLLARWSEPSDALELVVTGVSRSKPHLLMKLNTSTSLEARTESRPTAAPGPTEDRGTSRPDSTAGPTLQNYTVPNLLQMGLAGFVLAVLGVLLAWPGWRGSPLTGCLCLHRHFHFLRVRGRLPPASRGFVATSSLDLALEALPPASGPKPDSEQMTTLRTGRPTITLGPHQLTWGSLEVLQELTPGSRKS
ncbi:uncharacterized protein LOC110219828 [Phascolarctos cinereus]